MIVATAGHIDHGKTSLVKAITGVDTDRLPAEKERGISIDIGFAYWQMPDGGVLGFVDVPGHERFVRNMLAGVCGIDFALLAVAADDGVMPQTIEHVQILDLLAIRSGIAVITKVDRVNPARVQEVRREIAALLQGTSLDGIAILEASAVAGTGLDAVKAALAQASAAHAARRDEDHHFRFAIDRAFTIGGSGTVVTGTVFAGEVTPGARLLVSPRGTQVRVRGLRMHGTEETRAAVGQRCALNLAGIAVEDVARGDWICDEAIHAPTQRIDASLALLPGTAMTLTDATRVHVHLGAGEELARIAPLGGRAIAAGERTFVQLVLDRPVSALHGDRFILRDSAARRTIGGGIVLDPFALAKRRRSPERIAMLEALALASPQDVLHHLLALAPAGVDLGRFEINFNLRPDAARALHHALDVVTIGEAPRMGLPRAVPETVTARTLELLRNYHDANPAALGMREADLHAAAAPALALRTFQALLHELARDKRVAVSGGIARLPAHDATANRGDRELWERAYPRLVDAGTTVPTVVELAQDLRVDAETLRGVLFRRRASGAVFRVEGDRFYPRATFAAFAATAAALCETPPGTFIAAQFRDAIGSGRTLAIHILEALDDLGVTLRIGDARRMQRDFVPLLGAASPLRATPSAQGKPVARDEPRSDRRPARTPPRSGYRAR
jgi:selenocysteine-specific elongation factor